MPHNVTLREVVAEDLPLFYEHQIEPKAAEMAALPPRQGDAFQAHWQKLMSDESVLLRTILYDGEVAGSILSFLRNGVREVGYWLGKSFWGKGIATQALMQFLEIIKERPLHANVAKHNIASRKVLEHCGFVFHSVDSWVPSSGGEPMEGYIFILK